MKSLKLLLWFLVIIFLVVVVVQNIGVFTHKEALRLNLLVVDEYKTEPIHLFLYFLGFFFMGLLLAYFYGLSERFKSKSVIKNHLETIRKLEEEIRILKSLPVHNKENTPSEETENA